MNTDRIRQNIARDLDRWGITNPGVRDQIALGQMTLRREIRALKTSRDNLRMIVSGAAAIVRQQKGETLWRAIERYVEEKTRAT